MSASAPVWALPSAGATGVLVDVWGAEASREIVGLLVLLLLRAAGVGTEILLFREAIGTVGRNGALVEAFSAKFGSHVAKNGQMTRCPVKESYRVVSLSSWTRLLLIAS